MPERETRLKYYDGLLIVGDNITAEAEKDYHLILVGLENVMNGIFDG